MYKYADFFADLKQTGLLSNDTVMIHSAFSSIKNIEGGANTVLKALKDYFKDGLVLLPTHTWASMKEDGQIFYKEEANSCVGYLTNMAILDKDFYRSNHPTHSVVAYGKKAVEYIKGDDFSKTPADPDGSFGRLKNGGYILFIGAPLSKNTFIHSIEEEMNVPLRFTEHIYTFYTLDKDRMIEYHMPRHYNKDCPHISDNYEKLLPIFIELGAAKKVKILDSKSYLLDAAKVNTIVKNILKKDIHAFDDNRDVRRYIMLRLLKSKLIEILKEENVKSITINGNKTSDFSSVNETDTITMVDLVPFDDFIINCSNKNNLYLFDNNYSYEFGFKSLNDLALREYNIYPQTFILPVSDPMLGLLGNFLDEWSLMEDSDIQSFIKRSYEVYKLICDELKDKYIVLFNENYED